MSIDLLERRLVPLEGVEVQQHGARRVGHVGFVHAAQFLHRKRNKKVKFRIRHTHTPDPYTRVT